MNRRTHKRFTALYLTREWLPLSMISAMYNELITKLEDLSAYLARVAANRHGRCARTRCRFTIARLYVEFVQLDLLHDWRAILYRGNCLCRHSAAH